MSINSRSFVAGATLLLNGCAANTSQVPIVDIQRTADEQNQPKILSTNVEIQDPVIDRLRVMAQQHSHDVLLQIVDKELETALGDHRTNRIMNACVGSKSPFITLDREHLKQFFELTKKLPPAVDRKCREDGDYNLDKVIFNSTQPTKVDNVEPSCIHVAFEEYLTNDPSYADYKFEEKLVNDTFVTCVAREKRK